MSVNPNDKNSGNKQTKVEIDQEKRKFLIATSAVGAVGCATAAVPFVLSMTPSERAKAAGAPVEVDVSKIAPGDMMISEYRGQPLWVIHRTDEQIAKLASHDAQLSDPDLEVPQQPDYCKNKDRAINPKYAVMLGTCTHLGCSPAQNFAVTADWDGGFVCACHGSKFDLAGRVFKGSPAPTNLVVPKHQYLTETTLLVGEDKESA